MQVKFFTCECLSPHHILRTIKCEEEDEIYVSVVLTKFPFWRRLITGIKYIFGRTGHWEHFEELINFLKND